MKRYDPIGLTLISPDARKLVDDADKLTTADRIFIIGLAIITAFIVTLLFFLF